MTHFINLNQLKKKLSFEQQLRPGACTEVSPLHTEVNGGSNFYHWQSCVLGAMETWRG